MIILSLNIEERRDYRVQHCYPDIVFQRSHHVIHKHAESLGMEAIYASATLFSQFLLDNKIANPDYIGYEIDDLQVELPNMTDLLLLLILMQNLIGYFIHIGWLLPGSPRQNECFFGTREGYSNIDKGKPDGELSHGFREVIPLVEKYIELV